MELKKSMDVLLKKIEKNHRKIIIFSTSTVIAFVLLITFAMYFYPDGVTPSGLIYENYSFSGNFLSDLGMSMSFGSNASPIAPILFNLALILLAVGLIVLNFLFYVIFRGIKDSYEIILKIGVLSGFLAPVFLVLIGVFPKDTYYAIHEMVAPIFFIFALVWVLTFNALLVYSNKNFKKYAYMGYIFLAISLIYTFVPLIFPGFEAEESIFKPLFQKFTVISLIIVLFGDLQACRKICTDLFQE